MRSLCTRLTALIIALAGFVVISPGPTQAEVGGVHLNLTPYAGFATWGREVNLQDKLIYGGRVGLGLGKRLEIEGTYGMSSTDTQAGNGTAPWTQSVLGAPVEADFTHLAGDLLLNLAPDATINPYLFGGYGSHKIEIGTADESYSGLNLGGGLKMHFSPRTALRLEARNMMWDWTDAEKLLGAPDDKQSSMAYTAGLQFTLGGTSETVDTDGDGVSDKKDECPNTPAGCVVDSKGCPIDSDGDGVCDGIDTCPNTPSGVRVDDKGCPSDSDGDGVPDGPDQCPNTPAGCTVDANGCPVDSDRDGVCDGLDQCANTPAGARVDDKGCPMDSDGDGVWDGIDQCPNTPAGARVDKDGCPIEISKREMEMLEKGSITARDIYFDTAKSTLKPESEATLRELCTIFQQWPSLQIEIGGHTDSQGSDAYNQGLSDERSGAVLSWLQANCSNATLSNFTAKGYGESTPVATNATAKGRASNRRVEFKVLNPEELKRLKERREMLMKESGGK
jgi:OmpA-OmpF porin, OOP family